MKSKFYFLLLFLVSFLFLEMNLYSQDKYILYLRDFWTATDEHIDQGFIDLLTTEGYPVEVKTLTYRGILSAEELDSAKNAALIIWSKSCSSVEYAQEGNTELHQQWHNIAVPLISLSPWLLRSSRAMWFNSTAAGKNWNGTDNMCKVTIAADHPIFSEEGHSAGMTLPAYNVTVINTNEGGEFGTDNIDVSANGIGNGTILATTDDGSAVLIAEFEADTKFYDDGPYTPAHKRMFFAAGTPGDSHMGVYNLVPMVSEEWFKNAVKIYYDLGNVGVGPQKTRPDLLSVFPNPAKDVLKLTLQSTNTSETEIAISDITGKIVYRKMFSIPGGESHLDIDVSHLARGIYLLRTDLDNNELVRKVILE